VDEFLRFIAVNAFISNTDSYLNGNHNFYVYLDPNDDKFRFVPWDQDLSLASRGGFTVVQLVRGDGTVVNTPAPGPAGGGPDMLRPANTNQRLIYLLLDDPEIAAQYRAIIRELAATAFSPDALTKLMDALEPVSKGSGFSPRAFLLGRAAVVQQLVAGFGR